MRKIHCESCGIQEDAKTTKPKIQPVVFTVIDDPRNWSSKKEYEADLCPDCQGRLLHNYFGIKAEGSLDLPAFIEPVVELRAIRR